MSSKRSSNKELLASAIHSLRLTRRLWSLRFLVPCAKMALSIFEAWTRKGLSSLVFSSENLDQRARSQSGNLLSRRSSQMHRQTFMGIAPTIAVASTKSTTARDWNVCIRIRRRQRHAGNLAHRPQRQNRRCASRHGRQKQLSSAKSKTLLKETAKKTPN